MSRRDTKMLLGSLEAVSSSLLLLSLSLRLASHAPSLSDGRQRRLSSPDLHLASLIFRDTATQFTAGARISGGTSDLPSSFLSFARSLSFLNSPLFSFGGGRREGSKGAEEWVRSERRRENRRLCLFGGENKSLQTVKT